MVYEIVSGHVCAVVLRGLPERKAWLKGRQSGLGAPLIDQTDHLFKEVGLGDDRLSEGTSYYQHGDDAQENATQVPDEHREPPGELI